MAALSSTWEIVRQHKQSYTGGKVQLSGCGRFLVCWCEEDVTVLDIATGQVTHQFDSGDDGFSSFALHPKDGQLMTSGIRSFLLKRWDLASGKEVQGYKGHSLPVLDMAYDPSGILLATASTDRSVRVWNAVKGFCTHNFKGHNGIVMRVVWNRDPGKKELVSAGEDGEVRVWDLRTKKCKVLANHMSAVNGVAYSPDHRWLVTAGRDKVVSVWDVAKGYKLRRTIPVFDSLTDVVCLPAGSVAPGVGGDEDDDDDDDMYFVVSCEKGRLMTYSLGTLKCIHTHLMPHAPKKNEEPVAAAAVGKLIFRKALDEESPLEQQDESAKQLPRPASGSQLIAVTMEHNFVFYNAQSLQREKLVIGFNDEIIDIATLPDNQRAVVATNSAEIRLFDLDTFDSDLLVGHANVVLCVDVSPDGRFVVTGSKDNTVRFWHLGKAHDSSRCVAVCEGHAESVGAVSFSKGADGQLFAVSGSRDQTIKVWDCSEMQSKLGDEPSPEDEGLVEVRSVSTAVAHKKDINTVAVAPNDKLIASGSQDRTICLWNTDLDKQGTLKGHKRGVWAVEFSPIDKVLASCSGDKTIKIWGIEEMTCLKTFEGHTNSVLKVQFLNCGMQLMSTGSDAVMKLWTIKTNECNSTFEGHEAKIWALSLCKDQKRAVTGGADSLLCVWRDVTEEQRDEAAAQAEQRVEKEQDLSNAMRASKWEQAAALALELAQPRRLLRVFEGALAEEEAASEKQASEGAAAPLESTYLKNIVAVMPEEHISLCLSYCQDWNVNSKTCHVAHKVMGAVLRTFPPEYLRTVPKLADKLQSLVVYSERHFKRLDQLLQKSYLLDFTVFSAQMGVTDVDDAHAMQVDQDADASDASTKRKQPSRGASKARAGAGRQKKKSKTKKRAAATSSKLSAASLAALEVPDDGEEYQAFEGAGFDENDNWSD